MTRTCELVAGYDSTGGKAEDRICRQPAVARWLGTPVCADCLALIEAQIPPDPGEVEALATRHRGIAGDECAVGNECGRLGCEECQQ